MNQTIESNYDKVRENWRQKFLSMDQEALIRRFRLTADENALYLTYFSRVLRIDRKDGSIVFRDRPELPLTFNTVISIYNMFHYAKEHPMASGDLVPFRKVKRVYPFETAYQKTILKPMEDFFSGHVPELKAACEKLHGTPLSQGDVGYVIPVFPFLDIAVLFWDSDEEFPAQANMLFDSAITDFMHEENVVGVASDALYFLTLETGRTPQKAYG